MRNAAGAFRNARADARPPFETSSDVGDSRMLEKLRLASSKYLLDGATAWELSAHRLHKSTAQSSYMVVSSGSRRRDSWDMRARSGNLHIKIRI